MGRRNPIHVIGEPIRKGVTWLSDELIRAGAHDDALGSDGFVVVAYLLSRVSAPHKPAWETSAVQISEQFGWGLNRERAKGALDRAVKDRRLLIRRCTQPVTVQALGQPHPGMADVLAAVPDEAVVPLSEAGHSADTGTPGDDGGQWFY